MLIVQEPINRCAYPNSHRRYEKLLNERNSNVEQYNIMMQNYAHFPLEQYKAIAFYMDMELCRKKKRIDKEIQDCIRYSPCENFKLEINVSLEG